MEFGVFFTESVSMSWQAMQIRTKINFFLNDLD